MESVEICGLVSNIGNRGIVQNDMGSLEDKEVCSRHSNCNHLLDNSVVILLTRVVADCSFNAYMCVCVCVCVCVCMCMRRLL